MITLLDANAVGWTLIHSLWQGAVVVLVLALLSPLTRRWSAASKYGLYAVSLGLVCIMPIITWLLLMTSHEPAPAPVTAVETLTKISIPTRHLPGIRPETDELVMPWLAGFWAVGVLLVAIRRVSSWIWLTAVMRRMKAAPLEVEELVASLAGRMGLRSMPRLRIAHFLKSPAAAGSFRPLILVPASYLAGTTPQHLEAVLAHELAHIRRHDYFVNLVQCAAETLLFYHPVVWWLSRQMRAERRMLAMISRLR